MGARRSETFQPPLNTVSAQAVSLRVPSIRFSLEVLVLAAVAAAWASGSAGTLGRNAWSTPTGGATSPRWAKLREMRTLVPPDARIVASLSDESCEDLMLVCRFEDRGAGPAWSDTMVLWSRATLPDLLIGIADRPVEVPSPGASIEAWRAFLVDSSVRVLPMGRRDSMRRTIAGAPAIGRRAPVDPCLD